MASDSDTKGWLEGGDTGAGDSEVKWLSAELTGDVGRYLLNSWSDRIATSSGNCTSGSQSCLIGDGVRGSILKRSAKSGMDSSSICVSCRAVSVSQGPVVEVVVAWGLFTYTADFSCSWRCGVCSGINLRYF